MRLTFNFFSEKNLKLPISYNEIIQGFIYRHLNKVLSDFLHNHGFTYEKRRFKLFTFSRLMGKMRIKDNTFEITPPFKLIVSSPYEEILRNLAENLIKPSETKIGHNTVYIESINVHFMPRISEEVKIKMLSPVTIYSTFKEADGRKKTYYYNPFKKKFSQLIKENILKKYSAIYKKKPDSEDFIIEPIRVSKKDEKIVKYKDFIIKGWMGIYNIKGNPELIKLAYDAGIGNKNSQGFGCFEIIK
jgi:CRISPR-associated endoribonuclease Cas6